MIYVTNCAISLMGSRVEKGTEIELTEKDAARLGTDVSLVGKADAEEEKVEVPGSIEEMSHAQLKDKAKELGLAVGGSKADLVERIKLAEEEKVD